METSADRPCARETALDNNDINEVQGSPGDSFLRTPKSTTNKPLGKVNW